MKLENLHRDAKGRRFMFEVLVLQGLYYILLCQLGFTARVKHDIEYRFRGPLLDYIDTFGNQSEGAPRYRREEEFPTFWPPENLDHLPDGRRKV